MQIKKAVFTRSMQSGRDFFNEDLPEIAVVGKSNVGKSSLINLLTNNGKLARVSKQPGKTRLVNFFLINDAFYLVDLPGYGFARVSKAEKASWDGMMRDYFETARQLRAVLILMDIRHAPTQEDKAMVQYVEYYAIPYLVVATKADKIAKSKRKAQAEKLRKEIPSSFAYEILPFSSEDGYGKEALLERMEAYLATPERGGILG